MSRTVEILYTWPNGRTEVRYRRPEGSDEAKDLMGQVDGLMDRQGSDCPYGYRFVDAERCENG